VSDRRAIFLTARREVLERARSRAFLFSTLIQIAVVIAIVVVAAATEGGAEEFDVGTVGGEARAVAEAGTAIQAEFDAELKVEPYADEESATAAVEDGDLDAALVAGRIITEGDPNSTLAGLLQQASAEVASTRELRAAGLDDQEIRTALNPAPLTVEEVGGERGAAGVAFVSSLLLYIALLGAGITVATGVVEEKSTRVVEVILSAIRPVHLLAGKILGIGVLSLGQVLLIVVAGLGAALPTGLLDLPDSTLSTALLIALFFVLGYVLYACAFAVSGSLVSRQEDAQNAAAPLSLILIAGYLVAISASDTPDSTIAVVSTFIPPLAPMIVPSRAAHDALPAGELVASIVLMVVASALLLWLAARIYDRAVLRMGAPIKLKQALRLAR
jgi:ABC-2 type transport system permease protein